MLGDFGGDHIVFRGKKRELGVANKKIVEDY